MNKKKLLTGLTLFLLAILLPAKTTASRLRNIRYFSYPGYTRVVLDLSAELRVNEKHLPGTGHQKDRLYFDLAPCAFDAGFPADKKHGAVFPKGHLSAIRIAPKAPLAIRVVFDSGKIIKHQKFYLTSPFRIVFDIFHDDNGAASKEKNPAPLPRLPGEDSLARQLGLGVRTIVIDPGHGGKDPGTLNQELELTEKAIVLDIALELRELFKKHPEYRVVFTRESDLHLSLEERTAIANSEKGDLFISLHVNSSPRDTACGVETYFLSMTSDPWSQQVAAVENMISEKSIAEMPDIVERMFKNTKIKESEILASHLQTQLVQNLDGSHCGSPSLGVKKAPFFVLIGARMPAALAEVSFLSNPAEAAKLNTPAYRRLIAEGVLNGIIFYIKSLGKK